MLRIGRSLTVPCSADRNRPWRLVEELSVWSPIRHPLFAVPSTNACTSAVTGHVRVTFEAVPVATVDAGDAATAGWFVHVIPV